MVEFENMSHRYSKLFSRSWKLINSTLAGESLSDPFTITSYNILADSLVQKNEYLYNHIESDQLQWKKRSKVLLKELQERNSDIYCLQEVDQIHYERDFLPFFKQRDFYGSYKQRTGGELKDGCAIFVNHRRFKIIKEQLLEYHQGHLLDRNNVAIIIILQDRKDPSCKLCVANTHILFNPKRGLHKVAQLDLLFNCIRDLMHSDENISLVLCGDFNTLPYTSIFNYITKGNINLSTIEEEYMSGQVSPPRYLSRHNHRHQYNRRSVGPYNSALIRELSRTRNSIFPQLFNRTTSQQHEHKHILTHDFDLRSVYFPFRRSDFTTYHQHARLTCDYIFYGNLKKHEEEFSDEKGERRPKLALRERLALPAPHELQHVPGFPWYGIPSDHLSISARFQFVME
ncbi:uncharacterized protein VTP21DRAFT_9341 [Calcarisporiella thermophila]|uniref:uncharacterized protein n=1 Tax=Calcarisporiella thermophila TaxID=911321 RepID=UPI003742E0D2